MMKLALLGSPIAHSRSPEIHEMLFTLTGLRGEYGLWETDAEALPAALDTLQLAGYQGVNITMPLKIQVIPLLNTLDKTAQLTGAINTVLFSKSGERIGYNTDVIGFQKSVSTDLGGEYSDKRILVLGAGGSARAVIAAMLSSHQKQIAVQGRDQNRLNAVVEWANSHALCPVTGTLLLDDLSAIDWVVHCTPIGAVETDESPLSDAQVASLPVGAMIDDLTYNRRPNLLAQQAAAHGIHYKNGLDMLVWQAIASFQIWTGANIPANALGLIRKQL